MSRSRIWIFLFLLLTGLDFESSGDEKHSLVYIYTGFSKNPDLPGFHQFTVVGLLDGKTVSYFDSDTRKMEPRQDWMKDRLNAGYWVQKTESCISKEQQFKDIIQTMKDRLRQNDNDMHVLQRIHGCEGTGGTQNFSHIIDWYRYDGQSLLFFNNTNSTWVADLVAAKEIQRKWNQEPGMKDGMKTYLRQHCMREMTMFLDYKKEQLINASPPEVFLSSKKTKDPSTVLQTCFTTDFYPKDIDLNIKRDDRILTLEDRVKSSGIRPNGDDTYQRRDMVEMLRAYTAKYSCEVIHQASGVDVEEPWAPPEVFIFSKKTKDPSIVLLTCHTTGLYWKEIDLNIKRDGRVLTLEDGVKSSGTRPNGDDTYQRRDMVEILQTDTAKYSCEVIHRASKLHVEKQWDGVLPEEPNWGLIIGVLGGLVLLVVVLVLGVAFAWFKRLGPFKTPLGPRQGSVPSISSSVSSSSGSSGVSINTDGSGLPLLSVSHVSVDIPNPSDRPDEE